MEYRLGKCSKCDAEYKVPASFTHDVARCKVCRGVVHLGPPGGAAPSAAADPAQTPPAAAPELVEVQTVNAEQKRKERGTLARLKAERARARAAGAASAPPADDLGLGSDMDLGGDLDLSSGLELSSDADLGPVEEEEPAAAPAPRRPSSGRAARPLSAKERRAAARPKPKVTTRDGTRLDRAKARGQRGGKGKLIGLGVAAVLVAVMALAFVFQDRILGRADEAGGEVAAASSEEPSVTDAGADAGDTEETGAEPAAASTDTPDNAAVAPADPAPEPEPVAKEVKGDPASVDLSLIPDFGPPRGTTDDEWAQMQEWMQTFMDLDAGAAGTRAGASLKEMGYKAYPVIVNHMKTIDFATEDGVRKGDMCQASLQEICNGSNFEWRYRHDEPADVYFNKKVVQNWAGVWRKVEEEGEIDIFIRAAKLDLQDEEHAAELRALYYGEDRAGSDQEEFPPPEDDFDDLDVD